MKRISLLILIAWLSFIPSTILAQGLVPDCEGASCSSCHLVSLANNVIDWLIGVLTVVFAVLVMIAGFKLVTSGGNTSAKEAAKSSMTNAVIGFIIVLAAWILIDTLMRALIGNDGRINGVTPWAEVQCWSQADTNNLQQYQVVEYEVDTENNPAAIVGSGTSVTPVGASQMTSLRNMDVVVANWHGINGPNRTDRVHPTVAQAVKNMQEQGKTRFGNGRPIFQVTAAYTNGVGHSTNSQHYRGTAVDLQPINGGTYDQILRLCREAGFTFVNDERSHNHIHCDMR